MRTAVYQSPYLAGLPGWDRRIIPYTLFAGKILYKASDLEKMLEANYSRIKTVDVLLKRKWHLEHRGACFKCHVLLGIKWAYIYCC